MAALLSELIPELTVALSDGLSVLLLFLGTFLLVAVIAGLDDWSQSRDHDLPERVYRLRAPHCIKPAIDAHSARCDHSVYRAVHFRVIESIRTL